MKSFVRNPDGNFVINGTPISRTIFCAMEPSYTEMENMEYLRYTENGPRKIVCLGKHHLIEGVWEDGERYMNRVSDYVQASAIVENDAFGNEEQIRSLVEMNETPRGKRRREYPPIEDLVIALWENLIEKKSKKDSGVEQIQKLRKAVKAKYPTESTDGISTNEEETN